MGLLWVILSVLGIAIVVRLLMPNVKAANEKLVADVKQQVADVKAHVSSVLYQNQASAPAPSDGVTASGVSALEEFIQQVKAEASMSPPSRMAVCALIATVEAAAENLPNLDERAQARDECRSLGSKFVVTPTPAAPVPPVEDKPTVAPAPVTELKAPASMIPKV